MTEAAAVAAFVKSAAIFVGKSAAGAAISNLVKKALDRLSAEDEDLRRKLTEKLPVIEAVFSAGDQPQVRESQGLGNWLWQFRNALQEAEDALDELVYTDLEKVVKDRADQTSREAKDWKVRLSSRLPHIRSGFRRSLSAVVTGGTSKRLKDALKELDSVLGNAQSFISVISMNTRTSSADNQDSDSVRETTRELTTTTVFGRQDEKDEILKWLGVHTPSDALDHNISVCAIVGGGGMGKTTLAQFICQDKMVQDHFSNMIIWVYVSKNFDPKVLVRRILESIDRGKASAEGLDTLQSDLTTKFVTKRFLLILDDAWEDMEDQRWEQFLGPLRNNAIVGGRILLTTRMKSVADAVKRQIPLGYKYLELKGLDQENTLKLFNHHAFNDSTTSYNLDLQLIGEQIARKLKGCPFVAKVIGQQLMDNTDHSRWNTILNQDIQQFDEIAPRIMEMLNLSYQNLTYEIQLCFHYCRIFPPDYKFKMEEVIEMWVSSGLIFQTQNRRKDLEDTAREHFIVLVRKSFFSLVPKELHADPSEDYYVMHDLMYVLACYVSSEECCYVSSEECSRLKTSDHNTSISTNVRHLNIEAVNSETIRIISQSKYLRTLIIANKENSLPQELVQDLKKAIKGRISLRLLKLYGNGWFGMNDVISELKHLRYISMSTTDVPNLCKLFKLYHLEILRILKIEREEKVGPIDASSLPHLQKLYLPKSTLSRIPHIGRLITLRELNGFSVNKTDGYKITELSGLQRLQKVIVLDAQNISNYDEASAAALDKKTDMKVLSLQWSDYSVVVDHRIFNKLVPNCKPMHVIISGYNGMKPPMWMECQYPCNLVHLNLDGCIEWDKLPPLGSLWTLKHVALKNFPKLKYIASPSYGHQAYGYQGKWTKRTAPDGLPPHLVTLVVKDCPELLELPDLPFSLCHLRIDAVGVSSLPTMCNHRILRSDRTLEPQLSVLHIQSCDLLVSLDGCFLQEEHYKALTVLELSQCHLLSSLPGAADFHRISKLESVVISGCDSLSSLGGLGALSSLKLLKIENCDKLIITSSSRLTLAPAESSSLKLDTLDIDNHLLLLLNPLRKLCLNRKLIISGTSEMAELPKEWLLQNRSHLEHIEIKQAEFLQSLPLEMQNLLALRSLVLHDTPLLQSLPVMPPNLWVLTIKDCCTEFNEKCQTDGSEWVKICRIPNRHISPK